MPREEIVPTCGYCGREMVWDQWGNGEAWHQPGWCCGCEDEAEEYAECPSCGYEGPVGGSCGNCAGEIGS